MHAGEQPRRRREESSGSESSSESERGRKKEKKERKEKKEKKEKRSKKEKKRKQDKVRLSVCFYASTCSGICQLTWGMVLQKSKKHKKEKKRKRSDSDDERKRRDDDVDKVQFWTSSSLRCRKTFSHASALRFSLCLSETCCRLGVIRTRMVARPQMTTTRMSVGV